MRGAQAALRKVSHVLEPVEQHLPKPLKSVAHELSSRFASNVEPLAFELGRLVRIGEHAAHADLEAIERSDHAASLFARTVVYGLEYSFRRLGSESYLVSGTLAAAAYHAARVRDAAPHQPASLAARLCLGLIAQRVAARAPGTSLGMGAADLAQVRIAMVAVTLWLLVERELPHDNEDEILALCVDVAASLEAEIAIAVEDEVALATLLGNYTGVIWRPIPAPRSPVVKALFPSERHSEQPVRRTVRRLRWFKDSFSAHVDQLAEQTGARFAVDERRLAATFVTWLRRFEAQKPSAPNSRRDYVGFAAGMMLQAMLEHEPLTVLSPPADVADDEPVQFWPEGYAFVTYCLSVRAAVLEQDYHEKPHVTDALADIHTWWSFRENVREDIYLCTGFLDLFAGDTPAWDRTRTFDSN